MKAFMVERFRRMNKSVQKGQILFVGSSLMEQFPINEIAENHGINKVIYNRGIGGYTIPEMLEAIDEQIFDLAPSRIFINIGTNDISKPDETIDMLIADYTKVLQQIKERLPQCSVYLMAYYPVNVEKAKEIKAWPEAEQAAKLRLERLPEANRAVEELAHKFGYKFIDMNRGLAGPDGQTIPEFSIDGIHMWPDAYEIVFQNMKEYILE
jgi:lysophospholipase L1-like esterase